MWQEIKFSGRLLLQSTLVLLVSFGLWRGNPQPVVQASTVNQGGDAPHFDDSNCKDTFPDFSWSAATQSRFRCGYLVTWENYEQHTGTIQLAVMVAHPDPKLSRKTDSVIWLAGGPGDVGIILPKPYNRAPDQALFFADLFQRDFIQFSQRGSKYSKPELTCSQYRAVILSNFTLENSKSGDTAWDWEKWNADLSAALRFCIDRFNDDARFTSIENYNSNSNALDVVTLIHLLRVDKANLYAGSYGTILAQHVLASAPTDIRSVVLDGVAPVGTDWMADYPNNMQRSLNEVFKSCESDPDCKKAYPDLEPFFYHVLDQLKEQPARISVKDNYYEIDPTTKLRKELSTTYPGVYLDDYGFLIALGDLLKSGDNIKEIPRIIYAAGNGHFKDVGNVYLSLERSQDFAWGMYHSIYCTEFAQFKSSYPDLSRVKPQLRVLYTASEQFINEVCKDFGRSKKSYGNVSITGDHVPVLIFNGKFDPVTPPDYGAQIAEALSVPPEFNLTSEISAHGSSFSSDRNYNECAQSILRNFFDDPNQPPSETPCWKKMQVENQKIKFNTFNEEIYLHRLSLWWQEWLNKTTDTLSKWWQDLQKKIEDTINQWWQDLLKWLDQQWQNLLEQFIKWLEELLREWLNQCFPSAFLPLGALAVVRYSRHRKKSRKL